MSKRRTILVRVLVRVLLLGCTLLPGALAAQGEKITLRMVPAPNQTIRLGMTQEMAFDINSEQLGAGPMRMEGKTTLRVTLKVGAPDAQGQVIAQFVYDTVRMDMSMNGIQMPLGAVLDSLVGKTLTITYDAHGKIADVGGLGEMGPGASAAKQMLTSLMGGLTNVTLGIGDTITVPNSTALPFTIPGMGDQGASNLESTIRFKLLAVRREGDDRVATLEQILTMTMTGKLEMHLTGTGTMQLNLDRGFVTVGSGDNKMDMTMPMPGTVGTMKMNGTMHMTMTGERIP